MMIDPRGSARSILSVDRFIAPKIATATLLAIPVEVHYLPV